MSRQSRRRFAEVVRTEPVDLGMACLLIAMEEMPDLDLADAVGRLDALAEQARGQVLPGPRPEVAAQGLRHALGERAGFAGQPTDYADLRSSLLPEVLARRRGLPILLSVVWLEVARRLDVPAYGVGLPGHFVVAIGAADRQAQLVDPFTGGHLLSRSEAAVQVRATAGVALERRHLAPCPPSDLLLRVLTNLRVLAGTYVDSIAGARLGLWAVELSLLLPAHPVGLRRERGQLLARLGDFVAGASELESYAEAVAPVQPAVAAAASHEAKLARARLN